MKHKRFSGLKRLFKFNFKRFFKASLVSLVLLPLMVALPEAQTVYAADLSIGQMKISAQYNGPYNTATSPASDTIAVSPNRVIEFVSGKYKIVNFAGKGTSGTLSKLIGTKGTFLSDQQVMWDPSTSRFYYSMLENLGSSTSEDGIAWGFSKTSTPSSPSDFCSYFNPFNYGSTSFPDRETLGDSQDFLLIGSDRFSTSTYDWLSSDVAWIAKPPAGTSCPTQSSLQSGIQPVYDADGTMPYSPVPARQIDNNPTGWVVAVPTATPANYVSMYSVTKNPSTGDAVISPPISLSVPSFTSPPNAEQAGVTSTGAPAPNLETTVYLSEAYQAFDPRVGHSVIWTSNTSGGGYGSQVNWYEINPAGDSLDQSGVVSSPSLDVYNGSIAPDRLVNGSAAEYGSNAVLSFNTSSASNYTAIQMVSIIGGSGETAMKLVKQSTGPDVDFTCYEPGLNYCRWGDYSGASPDPGANPNGAEGQVWLINQYNLPNVNDQTPVWRTLLLRVKP